MIKLMKIEGDTPDRKIYILCADDINDDLPATGAETLEIMSKAGKFGPLTFGSMIYDASGNVCILDSKDAWHCVTDSEWTPISASDSNED